MISTAKSVLDAGKYIFKKTLCCSISTEPQIYIIIEKKKIAEERLKEYHTNLIDYFDKLN